MLNRSIEILLGLDLDLLMLLCYSVQGQLQSLGVDSDEISG
jgi:hypothetical protein